MEIPKEEPKYPIGGYAPGYYGCTCVTCKTEFMGDKRAVQCEPCAIKMTKEEPKQETLEEVARTKFPYKLFVNVDVTNKQRDAFIDGAKWQQERMYNEEDIIEFAEWIINQDWDETEVNFPNNSKSTKELLQLWKEQKPKTVYYE